MRISVVVPMWNEESWVETAYTEIKRAIKQCNLDAQIVFATDGCTDRTVEIIKDLQKADPSLILFNDPKRLGRGLALRRVFSKLKTQYIIYMDSDLATDLRHLPKLVECLESGADIVTGSRLMKDSKCVRNQRRNWFSRVYNGLARILFRSKMNDHQCGFKGFNRSTTLNVVRKVKSRGWFWDTEVLIRGQREGLNVHQFPVIWADREEAASKVNLWKDAKNMGMELVQLRIDLLPKSLIQMMSFAAVGVSNTLISLVTLLILENTIGRGEWGYYIAYSVGIVNSFILNRKFTFKEKSVSRRTFGQFAAFVGMYLIAMVIYSSTATFVEMVFGIFYLLAALVGTAVEFLFTFSVSKLAIFREQDEEE